MNDLECLPVAEYGILAGRRRIHERCMTPATEVDLL
jgi:hypothetical protein